MILNTSKDAPFMTKNEIILDWLCRLRSDIRCHEIRIIEDEKFNSKYIETLDRTIELQKIRPEVEEIEWQWWIQDGRSCVKCLKCGGLDSFHAPFCHWCGASMKEVSSVTKQSDTSHTEA